LVGWPTALLALLAFVVGGYPPYVVWLPFLFLNSQILQTRQKKKSHVLQQITILCKSGFLSKPRL
jgi:hypothetical protein